MLLLCVSTRVPFQSYLVLLLSVIESHMDNVFKKGLILGGILAAGAAVWLVMSKHGVALTADLKKDLEKLAKNVSKNLHRLKDVTKEDFDDLVVKIVDEYAETKELAIGIKDEFVSLLQSRWNDMEAEYMSDKEDK